MTLGVRDVHQGGARGFPGAPPQWESGSLTSADPVHIEEHLPLAAREALPLRPETRRPPSAAACVPRNNASVLIISSLWFIEAIHSFWSQIKDAVQSRLNRLIRSKA